MRKFEGLKWRELTETEKETLLYGARAIDSRTGCKPGESCKCIIDFENNLSAGGRIEINENEDELSVDENAVIYDPTK